MRSRMHLIISTVLLVGVVVELRAQENEDCITCHESGEAGVPRFEASSFASSAHADLTCIACHAGIEDLPHGEKLPPVRCGECHLEQARVYERSAHGRAVKAGRTEAAGCRDCHADGHSILKTDSVRSPVNRKNVPRTCGRCHDDPKHMKGAAPTERMPFESYSHTVHGEAYARGNAKAAVCTDCHSAHHLRRAADSASKVFWRNVPRTCARCHRDEGALYAKSVHGRAVGNGHKEAPVCTTCHGEHTIRPRGDPVSPVSSGAVTKTCAGCHSSAKLAKKFDLPVNRIKTYMDTYHGLAQNRGDLHVANCASCHGFHDVLPHTDPASSIHTGNLAKTCGKCHTGAGAHLAGGRVHNTFYRKHVSVRFAARFYWFLIPLVIGGMLLHNGLDFLRKLVGREPLEEHLDGEMRMTVNERLQHVANALAFIALAYTGFVLKFPDAWWAWPAWEITESARRWVHRGAALLFCFVGVYHAGYMLGTRRGRKVLRGLLPVPNDLFESLKLIAYNAGLRKTKPKLSHPYNYIEKSEYWALVWGSWVMLVSGCVLAFPDQTLRYLPMWASDLATVVHLYEAALACLAIVVWHLYWVIFDPAVYPMSWVWLTGYIQRKSK